MHEVSYALALFVILVVEAAPFRIFVLMEAVKLAANFDSVKTFVI